MDWDFSTIFVHPPFRSSPGSRLDAWLAKCAEASLRHDAQVIALVPVSTNSPGWRRHVWRSARAVCFLYSPRLAFKEAGVVPREGALVSCAFVYWGPGYSRFEREFFDLGAVVDLHMVKRAEARKDYRFWLL